MDGECSTNGGEKRRIQALGGKLESKRPFGRLRRRWWIILKWIFKTLDGDME
jgi:hypothetical protein